VDRQLEETLKGVGPGIKGATPKLVYAQKLFTAYQPGLASSHQNTKRNTKNSDRLPALGERLSA
jgi:hypothetical protein